MFVFKIKDNSIAIDIVVTRALLALAAFVALIYRTSDNFWVNIVIAIFLFITSLFIKILLVRFRLNKLLLVGIAAVLLFIATHSVGFALVLVLYAVLVKSLYKTPEVAISDEGVTVRKMIGSNDYEWNCFTNIILKDNLLTMDFKNNKLLQLTVDETLPIDEKGFNEFCTAQITQ